VPSLLGVFLEVWHPRLLNGYSPTGVAPGHRVFDNLPLVRHTAGQLRRQAAATHLECDDAVSEGAIALIAADRSFDASKGMFSIYAGIAIRRRILEVARRSLRHPEDVQRPSMGECAPEIEGALLTWDDAERRLDAEFTAASIRAALRR
jgi:DNA-directed RNA polymerase specialized sigma subunit